MIDRKWSNSIYFFLLFSENIYMIHIYKYKIILWINYSAIHIKIIKIKRVISLICWQKIIFGSAHRSLKKTMVPLHSYTKKIVSYLMLFSVWYLYLKWFTLPQNRRLNAYPTLPTNETQYIRAPLLVGRIHFVSHVKH